MRISKQLLDDVKAGRVDLVQLLLDDLELFSEYALYIQTKGGNIVEFVFNTPQLIMHEWCEEQLALFGWIRAVLLKARQFGGSTYVAGRLFHKVSTRPNQHAKVVAHQAEPALKLLQMYQRFFDKMPEELRPMKRYQSKSELTFANPSTVPEERAQNPGLESSLGVYSAKSQGAGRGSTLRLLHCSEVAFWEDAEPTMLGLLNTVPSSETDGKGTEVFLESTANGVGNYFYNMYMTAKRGEGTFRALFIPWYVHPDYRATPPVGFEGTLTKLERELLDVEHKDWDYVNPGTGRKTLSLPQLFWRRVTIATLCANDPRKFQQEYPLTDTEAFVTSGSAFFDPEAVQARLTAVIGGEGAIFRGELEFDKKEPKLLEDELTGCLKIWKKPEPKKSYVYFADVAEGVEGGDRCCVQVLCRDTGEQVARWLGHTDPDSFAQICYDLGRYYNWAYGTPEAMGHGLVTLMRLKELGYPYIYTRQVYDQTLNTYRQQEGWLTTQRTRPIMLEALRSAFRDGEAIINCPDTLGEMQTFIMVNRKLRAQDGCHDDAVMALAGAAQMLNELPKQGGKKVKNWMDADGERAVKSRLTKKKLRYDPFTGALQ